MELIDDKTGQVLDRRAVGDFSDLDLVKMGLSFVPGAGQILAGLNVADAVRRGDLTGAVIGGTGLVPGMENINTALKVGQAVDQGNGLGAITALAGNKDFQSLTGLGNANIGGITTKDAMNTAKLIAAAQTHNIGAITAAAGDLINSPDLKTAGAAATILQSAASGNTGAFNAAVKPLTGGSTTGTKVSDSSDIINTLQNAGLNETMTADANLFNTGAQIPITNTLGESDINDIVIGEGNLVASADGMLPGPQKLAPGAIQLDTTGMPKFIGTYSYETKGNVTVPVQRDAAGNFYFQVDGETIGVDPAAYERAFYKANPTEYLRMAQEAYGIGNIDAINKLLSGQPNFGKSMGESVTTIDTTARDVTGTSEDKTKTTSGTSGTTKTTPSVLDMLRSVGGLDVTESVSGAEVLANLPEVKDIVQKASL